MKRYIPSQYDNPHKDWRMALRGMKMFIYYKEEMSPRFIFTKTSAGSEWKGYDQSFRSTGKALAWAAEKGRP